MGDTDATGVLYFAAQLSIAVEAFQEMIDMSGISLKKLISEGDYAIPVVHTESNYLAPIYLGDALEVRLTVARTGTSSFTLAYDIARDGAVVGNVTTTHVAVQGKESMPIPKELLDILQKG